MPPLPFAPESFYELAYLLSMQSNGDDAKLRTCISRAYYGALIVARDAKRLSTQGPGGHDNVINAYLTGNHTDAVIGESLRSLKKLRKKADYDPHLPCSKTDGTNALTYSSKVLKMLGVKPPSLNAAPAQKYTT